MRNKKSVVPVLLAVILCAGLLTACGGGEKEEVEEKTFAHDAGEFVTNVKDSKKMLSASITMEFTSEKLVEQLVEKEYVVRDVIVRRMRELTEADLEGATVEDTLSQSLTEALNEALDTKGISKVYIVRFVYQ